MCNANTGGLSVGSSDQILSIYRGEPDTEVGSEQLKDTRPDSGRQGKEPRLQAPDVRVRLDLC